MTDSMPDFYLASSSPRRAELLREAGFAFAVLPSAVSAIDETPVPGETPASLVLRLARGKAEAALSRARLPASAVVLAGDTVVDLDGAVLGKPSDRQAAAAMLTELSGRSHTVHTALAVGRGQVIRQVLVSTEVQFKPLHAAEIAAYVATGEPLDKAGSYAIQGRAAQWVIRLQGSYGAVVGLPQYEMAELLAEFGVYPLWHTKIEG
ncbi:Maf family protein [Halothiobacillus sp. DCM-1]|uniref:Maf family protein n=1 Tax=Halothiobacillus sp. DCM-1 TaxID=3112558 RepID=UPI00324C31F9